MSLKEWFIKTTILRGINKLKKEKPEMFKFLEGKKTYLTALAIFVLGGLQASGAPIPEWIYPILAALGLGALRAGIKKSGQTS